ncbi:MAG: hypothetical protein ROY99_11350 [Ignavibacterium sp.]|jgi:hypothetical protein|nr:hypothetical protein [Ignavibacterium sp.]
MISLGEIYAQSALGLNPVNSISELSFSSINSIEFNPSNYNVIKDWAFSFTLGGEVLSRNFYSSLYQISAGKKINDHYLQLRYSPGFQKEFVIKSEQQVIYGNENKSTLETRYLFKELFSAGYSYKFNEKISAGFNVRYLKEEFYKDIVTTIFSDTVYFIPETEQNIFNNWKIDLGLVWDLTKDININICSVNLLNLTENANQSEYQNLRLKQEKELLVGLSYSLIDQFSLNLSYETSSSFIFGFNALHNIGPFNAGLSISSFHDKKQNPFFAGINLSGLIITKYFDLALTWLKYFSNRTSSYDLNEFTGQGISNIINNQFSNDKILLNAVFKINTLNEQKVKFLDIEIIKSIYPALSDLYLDEPFATAKVINLTETKIEVNPSIRINNFSNEIFSSSPVVINAFDTADVKYYLIIPENYRSANPDLTYADFLISTSNDFIDDEIQKPLLINGINAWDGKVINLKYFIKNDLDFSIKYSKNILSGYKSLLDSTISSLLTFRKAEIIFNSFVKNMTYIADPRATGEYVQYPQQTLELKGGDCDDLSVCYSSLLESIGIETALIDYKSDGSIRHVSVLLNTKLNPEQGYLLGANDTKYFLRKNAKGDDEIWIPIETTSLTDFNDAWSIAAAKFNNDAINNFGLITDKVEIIDIY